MKFVRTEKYDKQFVTENLMGPNALKMLEELISTLDIHSGMKILDLGCGKGLTSIFLAKEFGATVYATDLWIAATDNYTRFKAAGLDNLIIPIHADAIDMPFADEYFDAIISIDAYAYFGTEASFMDTKLAPVVKQGAPIALAFAGFKEEIHDNLPSEILAFWTKEDVEYFHSCKWWRNMLSESKQIQIQNIQEMACFEEAWQDWLDSSNEYAALALNDKQAMESGAQKYMNFISILARKI